MNILNSAQPVRLAPVVILVIVVLFSGIVALDALGADRVIGCITALTGDAANYGRSTRQGLDLALADINAALARNQRPYRYRIVYQDDQMDPKQGPSAFHTLTTVSHVPLILGPFGSKVLLALGDLPDRTQVVVLSASATADTIADAGDYVFRTVPPNRMQARDCAEFALHALKATRAAIFYVNDDYGLTLRNGFAEHFVSGGGAVTSEDAYNAEATDFRTQLTKIRGAKPDIVFFPGYYKEPALILKQAHDLGLQDDGIVFLGTDGSCTEDLIRIAGKAAEGAYFSNLAADFQSTEAPMKRFLDRYHEKNQGEPDAYVAYYYDALHLVAAALDSVTWEPERPAATATRIKDALYKMPRYTGILGPTQFDARGEVLKPFAIQKVQDQRFVLVRH